MAGKLITGDVNVLLVKVSVPASVANVPVVGKVTLVAPVDVKVVGKAPAVEKASAVEILPPSVIVFPVLSMPVPLFAPGRIPVTSVLRGICVINEGVVVDHLLYPVPLITFCLLLNDVQSALLNNPPVTEAVDAFGILNK